MSESLNLPMSGGNNNAVIVVSIIIIVVLGITVTAIVTGVSFGEEGNMVTISLS